MAYDRVVLRHCNGTKLVEPVAHDSTHNPDYDDDEDEAAIVIAGMNGAKIDGIEPSVFDSIDRGVDFKWDEKPKVSHQVQIWELLPN